MAAASATRRAAVASEARCTSTPSQSSSGRAVARPRSGLAAAAAEVERVGVLVRPQRDAGEQLAERPSLGAGQPPGTGVEGAHGPAARRPRLLGGHAASVGPASGPQARPWRGSAAGLRWGAGSVGRVPRLHVAVALLLPQPPARDVDVLRAALGAGDLERVAPHLTLVPPGSLRAGDLPAALAVLRAAATASRPLTLVLGPVATFSPVTPTVHLAVDGAGADAAAELSDLDRLQGAVNEGPFRRPVRHAFVPHVTLLEQAPLHRISAARLALAHVAIAVRFPRLTLLSEVRGQDRAGSPDRRWEPIADVDLGGVRTLGRGGLPIELARGTLLDPEASAALDLPRHPVDPQEPDAPGAGDTVVVARLDGEVAGAAWGGEPGQRRVVGPVDGDVLSAAWLDARRAVATR